MTSSNPPVLTDAPDRGNVTGPGLAHGIGPAHGPGQCPESLEAELGTLVAQVYTSFGGLLERAERLAVCAAGRGDQRHLALAELLQANVYNRTNRSQEGMRIAHTWLGSTTDRVVTAQAHAVIGTGLWRVGSRADSVAHADQAVRLLDEADPLVLRVDHALIFAALVNGYRAGGVSTEVFEYAQRLAEELGDTGMIVANLNNWAWVRYEQGDLGAATDLVDRMLALSDADRYQFNASCVDTVARIMLEGGDVDGAFAVIYRALSGLAAATEADAVPSCLLTLAEIQRATGDHLGAESNLRAARQICMRHQLAEAGARALRELAACHAALGEHQLAYEEMVRFHDEWSLLRSTASEVAASVMQASFQVEDARRRTRQFRELSERDPLTGLWNRRKWDTHFRMLRADAVAVGEQLSLAVLDLDHFKQVNDQHSHVVGDEVLRAFAGMLTDEAGTDGRAVRLGGEEFLLILRAPAGAAVRRCDRVRLRVAEHDWSALAPGLRVTVSIGVSVVRDDDDQEAVLYRADRLLYTAKHRGRNLVVGEDPAAGVVTAAER